MNVIKVLEHWHTYEERLSKRQLFILEERRSREILSMLLNTWWGGVNKTQILFSGTQWELQGKIQCQEQQELAGARNQGWYHSQQGRGLATQSTVWQCPSKAEPEMVPRFIQDSRSSDKFIAGADLRSSQEVNPQLTIRSGEDEQGQIQSSGYQAGPWWRCRPKVRLGNSWPVGVQINMVHGQAQLWLSWRLALLWCHWGREWRAYWNGAHGPMGMGCGWRLQVRLVTATEVYKCTMIYRQLQFNIRHFHYAGGQTV